MSQNFVSVLGNQVQVLRQRYFIDHNPNSKTLLIEEYTIIGNTKEGVDNIILQFRDFLPNLSVFDSDGERLPVMPNNYTKILIKRWIKEASDDRKKYLKMILDEMETQKSQLIWIKLPKGKKLEKNESKIINLEYNAKKQKDKIMELNLLENKNHRIFYVIKYPKDHILGNKKMDLTLADGRKENRNGWEKHANDKMYFVETNDSIVISVKPNLPTPVTLRYKFSPAPRIVLFPITMIAFLTLSSVYLLALSWCTGPEMCAPLNLLFPSDPSLLLNRTVEIGAAIIATSLVLPRLISDSYIRHKMSLAYFIPVVSAILLLIKG